MLCQLKYRTKNFNRGLFVIALILISFTAGMAATVHQLGPGDGPHKPEPVDLCRYEVEGCVTYVAYRTIVIDGVTNLKTPLNWTLPQVADRVWIKYWVNPDGVKVACSMSIIGTCI